jgi:4-amino-4-deoxy-L-arabinose transferase-like glycosyltransferase
MKKPVSYAILALLAGGILGRLWFASAIGLGVDESYVAAVSRQFSLSYFDHPPLHFWIIHLTVWLTGNQSPVILRLPFILFFAGTTWLMYVITTQLFNHEAGFYAALLLNLSAVFSMSTGTWLLPDGPLMFFMLAAVFILVKILFSSEQKSFWLWILSGLFIGLGMLSKYHAVFILIGGLLFVLTSNKWRYLLLTPGPYFMALTAGVVFLPTILWNMQHHWISFIFQGVRGTTKGFYPGRMLANIAGQAIWVLPWVWVPLVWQLMTSCKTRLSNHQNNTTDRNKIWFLCCLAVGPILVFTLFNLWGSIGLPHWEAPGYLMLFPLLGCWTAERLQNKSKLAVYWLVGSVIAILLFVGILGSQAANGWLKQIKPGWFTGGDPTLEVLDWKELPKALQQHGLLPPVKGAPAFIATDHWIDTGKIDYILGGRIPVLCLNQEPHHFAFMYDYSAFSGKNALIISQDKDADSKLAVSFDKITKMNPIVIYRNHRPEIELSIYSAQGFKGYPLLYGIEKEKEKL